MFLPKFKKDQSLRFKFYKFEPIVSAKKFIVNSAFFASEIRVKARYEIFDVFEKYKVSRNYTNRCILTGHPKVAFRKYKISRMEFRRLAKIGLLKGLRKSSWLKNIFMRTFSYLIAHIRNAGSVQNLYTLVPVSQFNIKSLDILYAEGLISGYSALGEKYIKVFITYLPNGVALAGSLKTISCSSRRVYVTWKQLVNYYSGVFCLVSTSTGLLTGTEAIRLKIGGELICSRFYFLILF